MLLDYLLGILPRKIFELGTGRVIRYTLFECKWLFSVYFHSIETICQDRFHVDSGRARSLADQFWL